MVNTGHRPSLSFSASESASVRYSFATCGNKLVLLYLLGIKCKCLDVSHVSHQRIQNEVFSKVYLVNLNVLFKLMLSEGNPHLGLSLCSTQEALCRLEMFLLPTSTLHSSLPTLC